MPTQTLQEIILGAYIMSGLVPDNTVALSAAKADTGKSKFNLLLGLWSAKGLLIPVGTIESFTLTPGTASYTIGSGGTFNTSRPEKILKWWIRDSANIDHTETEVWGSERYQSESTKTTPGRPYGLWYQQLYPLSYIYLYPTPDAAESLYLYSEKPLTEVTVLTTSVVLPNEYLLALQTNLGMLLCAGKRQPSPDLIAWAGETLRTIQNKNLAMGLEKMSVSGFPGSGDPGRTGTILSFGS